MTAELVGIWIKRLELYKVYKTCTFKKADTITVLCRGASLEYIPKISSKIDKCFLVGQFDNALSKIGQYLLGKHIVQVVNKRATQTNRNICRKYNIQDIQLNFDGWLHRPPSEGRVQLYRKIQQNNPWATVHLAPPGIRERRGEKVDWATTGIYTVDLSCFYLPKRIIICGLDFYESDYFIHERIQSGPKDNKGRTKDMVDKFLAILERDSNVIFEIYTKSRSLPKLPNLIITHV